MGATITEEWTPNALRSLLYGGITQTEYKAVIQLCSDIRDKLIVVRECPYSITPAPEGLSSLSVEQRAYIKAFMVSSERRDHGFLKWVSWNWLRNRGEVSPRFDQQLAPGLGRVDVVAPSIRHFVECGRTRAAKVLRCLEADLCDVFAVFPYPAQWGQVVVLLQPTESGRADLTRRHLQRQGWADL